MSLPFEWFVQANWPARLQQLPQSFLRFCFEQRHRSHAQLFQDLFVIYVLGQKRDGYFVEFGATAGIELSNTYLLENEYGWNGILAEPARRWQAALSANRHAAIDHRFVWRVSGESIDFVETTDAEYSTAHSLVASDFNVGRRDQAARYDVESVSLSDLLSVHGAPKRIDYLSVDTEGSEFEILQSFDFSAYDIAIVTVEHNYGPEREQIFQLFVANGYERAFPELSKWDDWYVKSEYGERLRGGQLRRRETTVMDIYAESEPLALVGPGWYRVEKSPRGEDFRWVGPDASLNVARLTPEGVVVKLDVEPGPAVGLKQFRLGIFEDGSRLGAMDVDGRSSVEFTLPPGDPRVHRLSLHAEEPGEPVEAPGDKRTLNFRIFKIMLTPMPATGVKDESTERALKDAAMRIGQLEEILGAERRERSELERRLTREVEARDLVIGRLESVGVQARNEIEELSKTTEEQRRKIDELQALAEERLNVIRAMHETSETH